MDLDSLSATEVTLMDEDGLKTIKIEDLSNEDQAPLIPLIRYIEENGIEFLNDDRVIPEIQNEMQTAFSHDYKVETFRGLAKPIDRIIINSTFDGANTGITFRDGGFAQVGDGYEDSVSGLDTNGWMAKEINDWFELGNGSVLNFNIIAVVYQAGKSDRMQLMPRAGTNIINYSDGTMTQMDGSVYNNPKLLREINRWFGVFKQQLEYLIDENEMAFEASRR